MIQRRAARFTSRTFDPRQSVSPILKDLGWHTLAERRARCKLHMMYKILNEQIAIPAEPPYVIFNTRKNHHLLLLQHHCRILTYQQSYFPSVVPLWNSLPDNIKMATSLQLFKTKLEAHALIV